jgi:hypothetical protein
LGSFAQQPSGTSVAPLLLLCFLFLGRALDAQGFVRTFLVELLDETIELGVLLKEVCSGGPGNKINIVSGCY